MSTFHNTRASICPACNRVIGGDHLEEEGGVFLQKFCPEHGIFKTRIAADNKWLDSRGEYAARSVIAENKQTAVIRGCPEDCGECNGHQQKSAFFLFELTNVCDLSCPVCLGSPKEKGYFISPADAEKMVKQVVDYAGPGQIITLGGGEPTLHPDFFEVVRILRKHGMQEIWVYTNGRRIAKDTGLIKRMVDENLYIVLQWDGFSDSVYETLRGKKLLDEKKTAIDNLQKAGARIGLCPTVVLGVNDQELGNIYEMFVSGKKISTLDIATMAYVGKGADFENGRQCRMTAQDVLLSLEKQTKGQIRESDFSPVSFSHPECLQICYLFAKPEDGYFPLKRFLEPEDYRGLVLNKPLLALTPEVEGVFADLINRLWAKGETDSNVSTGLKVMRHLVDTLFPKGRSLSKAEFASASLDLVKVILVHSYMDTLNFDIGRTKMCISRTVQADGRLMPTCAFNVIHRSKCTQAN